MSQQLIHFQWMKKTRKKFINIKFILQQEPSDILLAAFAQVQSLTEALNDYIKIPQIQPTDMLVKSTSLCDDCFKNAEKQCEEQQTKPILVPLAPMPALPSSHNNSTSCSNNSQSPSTSTVINNKLTESTASIDEASILPDDDGYCEIDEIRLPAITKSPSIKINDPRRQSAAAPLPPDATDATTVANNKNNKTDSTNDSQTPPQPPPPNKSSNGESKSKNNNHDTTINEQISNASKSSNDVYDALAQPLAELNLNSEAQAKLNNCANNSIISNKKIKSLTTICDSLCLPPESVVGTQHSIPSIPCHLISAYVASLNLHISQLLVSVFGAFFIKFT